MIKFAYLSIEFFQLNYGLLLGKRCVAVTQWLWDRIPQRDCDALLGKINKDANNDD